MPKTRATHGGSHTRIYRIWQAMRDRTSNPRAFRREYYGGRGITVCDEWQTFAPFQAWALNNGYEPNLSIDRIDNDGNYEPSNCRWATQKMQVQNRRSPAQMKEFKMKTFKQAAAQGEISFVRIGDVPSQAALPEGFSVLEKSKGKYIVGQSETHHDHVMDGEHLHAFVMDRPPEGMRILRLIVSSPTPLVHLREHDTHEPIMFAPGEYEARITREFDPHAEIARQQMD